MLDYFGYMVLNVMYLLLNDNIIGVWDFLYDG